MDNREITLLFGGDICFEDNGERFFVDLGPLLEKADFRMAMLENPYIINPDEPKYMKRDARFLDPLVGRLDLVTLAGNHIYDFEERGVKDTIQWCENVGIKHCGAGPDIVAASKPAFVEKKGLKVGVLAYNVIGGTTKWAGEPGSGKSGCSYVRFHRAYKPLDEIDQEMNIKFEHDVWQIKKPIKMDKEFMGYNFLDHESLIKMGREVYEAKKQCDILITYFHKGYVHRPIEVAPFEKLVSYIAIDNGADVVMASHSHVIHGIEMYKGKAIYHGLNNFIMYVPSLSPKYTDRAHASQTELEWVKNRIDRFGFVPDPEYPSYPFHPESVYTATAKLVIRDKKIVENRAIMMKVEKDGIPYVHGNTPVGNECLDYLRKITDGAGLNCKYDWCGDEVVISEK